MLGTPYRRGDAPDAAGLAGQTAFFYPITSLAVELSAASA